MTAEQVGAGDAVSLMETLKEGDAFLSFWELNGVILCLIFNLLGR